jgi:hypothetical protein
MSASRAGKAALRHAIDQPTDEIGRDSEAESG